MFLKVKERMTAETNGLIERLNKEGAVTYSREGCNKFL